MPNSADATPLPAVPVDTLGFDPLNPRIPRWVDGHADGAVVAWMLEDASLLELMASIGRQGYFQGEPLLVIDSDGGEDTSNRPMTVVEGNRRLAALRLLRDPEVAPSKRRRSVAKVAGEALQAPDEVPVIRFTSRESIIDYLGFRHVTGIKEWDTLAKARYVTTLAKSSGRVSADESTRKDIAKKIGSRPDYVGRLLTAHALYMHTLNKNFFDLDLEESLSTDFSLLTTALSYESIAQFIGLSGYADVRLAKLDDANLRRLLDWLYTPLPHGRSVVGESRNLRELAEVVKQATAVAALDQRRDLSDAALLTEAPLQLFQKTVGAARDRLQLAQSQFHRVASVSTSDEDLVSEVAQLSRDLRRLVLDRLEDQASQGHEQ